jgi:hypothetical protein
MKNVAGTLWASLSYFPVGKKNNRDGAHYRLRFELGTLQQQCRSTNHVTVLSILLLLGSWQTHTWWRNVLPFVEPKCSHYHGRKSLSGGNVFWGKWIQFMPLTSYYKSTFLSVLRSSRASVTRVTDALEDLLSRAVWRAHLIVQDFIILIIFGEVYYDVSQYLQLKLWNEMT